MKTEKKNKWKEIWNHKKYRSLIQLGIYVLLVILFFFVFDFSGNQNISYQKRDFIVGAEKLSGLNNFEYTYVLTYVNAADEPLKRVTVEGKSYRKDSIFQIKETEDVYYKKGEKLYQVQNTWIPIENTFFDFTKLEPSHLQKCLDKMILEYTTDYTNQITKKSYALPIKDFAQIYMDEENEKIGTVMMSVYTKEKKIQKVELDMRDYNGMFIEIEYQKIGEVENFTSMYTVDE